MPNDLNPLPVLLTPDESESGMGFLLRVATANGLSLRALLHWMDLSTMPSIERSSMAALAHVTQTSADWLRARIPQKGVPPEAKVWRYLGKQWGFEPSFRKCWPQVCCECLKLNQRCRSEWELSGVFACPLHQVLLIDRCPHCRERLTWSRPTIDVCSCGHYLQARDSEPVSPALMDWVKGLVHRLAAPPDAPCVPLSGIPSWLDAFSIDGVFGVVVALGVLDRPHGTANTRGSGALAHPRQVAEVIGRGLQRAASIDANNSESIASLRHVLYEPGLQRMVKNSVTERDRHGASILLHWLGDVPRHGLSVSGRRPLGQIELFGTGSA